jgi:hypothetical protein
MMNNTLIAPNNEVMVAKRAPQRPTTTDTKMSLLVSSHPKVQSDGAIAGQSASKLVSHVEQPVVSPYLKAENAPQVSRTPTGGQHAALQTSKPVYYQATLPPSDGKWVR